MKKRRYIGWIVAGVVVLLPLLLAVLLQTPPGKALLAAELERRLSASDNLQVRIGRVSGWLPAAVRIESLEISDAEGVWLQAEGLHGRWMIRALWERRIHVAQLGAETLMLHRFPVSGGSARVPREKPVEFRPVEIVLDRLAIKQLKLGEAIAGRPLEYAVQSGGITLMPSGRLTGALQVDGDAEGRIELDALLGERQDNRLRIMAQLDRMINPSFGLDRLSGTAEVTLTREDLHGQVAVSFTKDDLDGRLTADLHYADDRLAVPQFDLAAYGWNADGELGIAFSNRTAAIRLEAAITDSSTNTYTLHTAATLSASNGWSLLLHPFEMTCFDQVNLLLEGEIASERLALDGRVAEFELSGLPIEALSAFKGGAGGTLTLTGSPANPEVQVAFDVVRFTSAQDALDELPELDFHVSGRLADGQWQASSVIINAEYGRLAGGFRMPCAFSLEPLYFNPAFNEIHAEIEADVDIGILNRLALLKDQRIAGRVDIDLVYDRFLSGSFRMEEGFYEHYDLGLVVQDMQFDLQASDEGLRIERAVATDGGSGRLSMSGGVASNRMDIVLDLSSAAIIRRDDADAVLSGRLQCTGALTRPDVTGQISVDRADILIGNIAPPLPPQLTNFDARIQTNRIDIVKEQAPLPFGLDMQVDLGDQVFANASMIDSVWGGTLRVRDVPEGVSIQGVIEPRRGFVSFIGKRFRFMDGQIDLDGSVPAAPVMNQLTAEYTRGDFSARLVLNGRFDNPDIRLESTPAMPEDEILSNVLFNRDTSSISPYQAFQIASAARQLSGGLSGPGFMYQMRQAVGVDTLEWRDGAEQGDASSVAAGKYLTPALYVEVNQSLGEERGTGMMAEFDLTRHISVETSTGPQMRPGIGVNWRYDY